MKSFFDEEGRECERGPWKALHFIIVNKQADRIDGWVKKNDGRHELNAGP